MEDHVTENLIVAIVAKFMDGLAGGCVLFVVSSASEAKNLINILWRFLFIAIILFSETSGRAVSVLATETLMQFWGEIAF